MKKLIVILICVVAIGVGAWLMIDRQPSEKNVVTDSNKVNQIINEDEEDAPKAPDLVLGSANAPVMIVEYADFKCPTCNKFTQTSYLELKKEYLDTGKAKIIFRNLPYIAADSRTAAEGAYCANEQGKFGAYHDLLYQHIWDEYYDSGRVSEGEAADVFGVDKLSVLVEKIDLGNDQFKDCLKTNKFNEAIRSDLSLSERDGATGTPTFIVGGQKVVGAQPFGIFDKLIKAQQ